MVKAPVFIVGCGESGTTLMRRLLGRHRDIHEVTFETCMFLDESDPMRNVETVARASSVFAKLPAVERDYRIQGVSPYAEIIARFADNDTTAAHKTRWVEKTPSHVRYVGRILSTFPESRVLIILRDGRDVAMSLVDRALGVDVKSAIQRWRIDNEAGEPYWPDRRVRVVKLEDVISTFADTMSAVCNFLGHHYDENIAAYNADHLYRPDKRPLRNGPASWIPYRRWLHEQPLFDSSGVWRLRMTSQDRESVKYIAGQALIRYGYESGSEW